MNKVTSIFTIKKLICCHLIFDSGLIRDDIIIMEMLYIIKHFLENNPFNISSEVAQNYNEPKIIFL